MHEHISPLLGEHPCIVNIFLGPVTVHYRQVSLYMISKKQRANIVKPILQIDGINIESVDHFNFLGLTLDSRMTWNNHTTNISNKCSRTIGVLNRIKHFIPLIVRILLYNTLILPHFNYCITAWGYQCDRIIKLQKKSN